MLINERGHVKVLDFGLVKHLFEPTTGGVDLDAQTIYATQTRSDVIVGTPLYLSPEQATGKDIDGRSDLFAVGALLRVSHRTVGVFGRQRAGNWRADHSRHSQSAVADKPAHSA